MVEGKAHTYVHDYVDYDVPMVKFMYFKRLRTYRNLGLVKGKPAKKRSEATKEQMSLF